MIQEINLDEAKIFIEKIILEAGVLAKKGYFAENKNVSFKGEEFDIVTQYDLLIEDIIVEKIKSKYPYHNFLTEETNTHNQDSDYTWIIDPIDGTRNFSRNIPLFMIGVALAKGDEVIMCFSFNPINKELFHAQKGNGAYLNNNRIFVSKNPSKNADVDIQISRSFKFLKRETYSRFIDKFFFVRNYHCCIYSTALVAGGRLDGFISYGLHPWDYSNYLLVKEAGGEVTDFIGEEFDLSKNNIVASNKIIHEDILENLKELKNE